MLILSQPSQTLRGLTNSSSRLNFSSRDRPAAGENGYAVPFTTLTKHNKKMEGICCHVTMFSIRRKGATPFTCQTFRRHSCHGCKSICNRKFHLLGQINHGTSWNYDFLLHSFHEVTMRERDLHANGSDDLITSKG